MFYNIGLIKHFAFNDWVLQGFVDDLLVLSQPVVVEVLSNQVHRCNNTHCLVNTNELEKKYAEKHSLVVWSELIYASTDQYVW